MILDRPRLPGEYVTLGTGPPPAPYSCPRCRRGAWPIGSVEQGVRLARCPACRYVFARLPGRPGLATRGVTDAAALREFCDRFEIVGTCALGHVGPPGGSCPECSAPLVAVVRERAVEKI